MAVLLLLLTFAADNNAGFFESRYPWLMAISVAVAFILIVMVFYILIRFYREYRRGKFGSRLTSRLVVLLALMGIIPGIAIYGVSVQFVSRSIESWFDVSVESALASGIKLGQAIIHAEQNALRDTARKMTENLGTLSPAERLIELGALRESQQVDEAMIVSSTGNILVTSSSDLIPLTANSPSPAMLAKVRMPEGFAFAEGGTDIHHREVGKANATPLRVRVLMKIPNYHGTLSLNNEQYFLQVIKAIPPSLSENADALQLAYSEYKTRSLGRTGLRKIYIVTLSLTLLLTVFAAITGAFLIATRLARPLLLLAQGTKAVAEGDFSPRPVIASPDELGLLTKSFQTMTQQLSDAREVANENRIQLEDAKWHLESVLANMSAGVMVLDRDLRIVSCNESVSRIFEKNTADLIARNLSEIDGLTEFSSAVIRAFSQQSAQLAATENAEQDQHWQKQIEISALEGAAEPDRNVVLLARGSRIHVEDDSGYLIVFDDISDVISAQRSIAWGEVARRLAHEIKNPLTPIQLSAERLKMKLEDTLEGKDAALLNKSTQTIVNQVESMKRMVDDFRNYSRTPPAVLVPMDMNALISELVHLYTGDESNSPIQMHLREGLPQVMADEVQMRQVVHNLLQNALDATMQAEQEHVAQHIDVTTESVHYLNADGENCIAVRLSVADNGPGFSPLILSRAFEPYVTSKERGTGLGLAMVKKIIEEHEGKINIENRADGAGARVSILLMTLA